MPAEYHPFASQLADELFDIYDYEDSDECYEDGDPYEQNHIIHHEECVGEQFELKLETVEEMEQRHLNEIRKLRRAYNKMAHHALKWHYLQCDIEDNAQIKKMFQDMQMMRKLTGSDNV